MKEILKEIWRLLYPVLVYFVTAFAVELAVLLILAVKEGGSAGAGIRLGEEELIRLINRNSLLITAIANGILIPIFLLFMRWDERKRLTEGGVRYRIPKALQFALLMLLGMTAAVSVNALVSLSGLQYLSPKYQEVSEVIYSGSVAMEIVSAVILAPVLEELMFRGLIYKRLRGYCGAVWAILISAAFFGVFHGNLVQFVYAFVIGCMLAFVYEKYKTIAAPIAFHMGANFLSVLLTEFLPQRYMTVLNVLIAMFVTLVLTVVLLKYVSEYKVEEV